MITCAPAEQLLRKAEAITIGVSRWEAQPAPQYQSNGAEDTQRAEMSSSFLYTGSGALKNYPSVSDARLGLEVAATAERWTQIA